MANPLYNMLMGGGTGTAAPQGSASGVMPQMSGGPMFANPIQKANYILQAMRNPAAFVRQAMPDIPAEIANDPNRILQYLQQTRGVTNEQIQRVASQIPQF